ncbi:MAG: hypothetical protein IJ198_01600 [Lachnospiraceae bacterium]|nr:hypothetical protein [Lachnospiraceae bacterium]
MSKRKKERTVAQLLSARKGDFRFQLLHPGKNEKLSPKHIYIYCRSSAIARRFLSDAEKEGFLFSDGVAPTNKDTTNLYALNDDFTICYAGLVAHMMLGRKDVGNVIWVDYGRYVSGEE